MPYLSVEKERSIYYEHRNAGAPGPTMVFIHGWGMSVRVWDGPMEALARAGFEVVAFDHRCCGMSDKDFDDVTIGAIASDVERLVSKLNLESVVLNGWSLGGAVAVDAAVKINDRLAGLVLTGGATPKYVQGDGWPHGGTKEDLEGLLTAAMHTRAVFMDGVSRSVCHGDTPEPVIQWLFDIFMQTSSRADSTLRDLGEVDQRGILPQIQEPVLLMHGRNDVFVPWAVCEEQAKAFPNAKTVEFPDAGHGTFVEDSERYVAELTSFLGTIKGES